MIEKLSPEELEDRANQAERLRNEPAFQRAIIESRKRHVEALIVTEPTNTEALRTLQAQIHAIDALCGEIADEILRGTPQRKLAVA